MDLVEKTLKGNRRALAKLISQVENNLPMAEKIIPQLHQHCKGNPIVGITGPPGVGKSTLLSALITKIRQENKTVAIIAIDPTSPFTGGALLGDRIRMQEHFTDSGVFIRSMATRGSLGGLAQATLNTVKIIDAFGFDVIIIETVGTGQIEIDIIKISDVCIVIEAPGAGDEIQAIKAGILEAGDILVVNKGDREGADNTVRSLQWMLSLNKNRNGWQIPVIKTTAKENKGIDELWHNISKCYSYYLQTNQLFLKRKQHSQEELMGIIDLKLGEIVRQKIINQEMLEKLTELIMKREIDPYRAASIILQDKEQLLQMICQKP